MAAQLAIVESVRGFKFERAGQHDRCGVDRGASWRSDVHRRLRREIIEIMAAEDARRQRRLGQLDEPRVMGKGEDLRPLRQLPENLERGARARRRNG
ncbi:hypothetical protein [Sorangium sp. So ce1182]|uniref:hypothetical protein n=1 Tax=Sorangium sp. So ce1182 TaxID=3133334 RepID=UPI003F642D0D